MLGRKDYTKEELADGRARVDEQLERHRGLAEAVAKTGDDAAARALAEFDGVFFINLLLTLDRLYVHRLRMTAGKDGNPLNEVELIVDSLLNNDGVFRVHNKSIKYVAEDAVTGLSVDDEIKLDEEGFVALSEAFFDDLEQKFVRNGDRRRGPSKSR